MRSLQWGHPQAKPSQMLTRVRLMLYKPLSIQVHESIKTNGWGHLRFCFNSLHIYIPQKLKSKLKRLYCVPVLASVYVKINTQKRLSLFFMWLTYTWKCLPTMPLHYLEGNTINSWGNSKLLTCIVEHLLKCSCRN